MGSFFDDRVDVQSGKGFGIAGPQRGGEENHFTREAGLAQQLYQFQATNPRHLIVGDHQIDALQIDGDHIPGFQTVARRLHVDIALPQGERNDALDGWFVLDVEHSWSLR